MSTGPYGVFTPDLYPDAPGFILIAGGVGIAPLMSMLRTFADRRDARRIQLIYGNRSWERVLFREEIDSLKERLNLSVTHVLSHPRPGWQGVSGILCRQILGKLLREAPSGGVYFLCGPRLMIQSAQRTLRSSGIRLRRIHFKHLEMA